MLPRHSFGYSSPARSHTNAIHTLSTPTAEKRQPLSAEISKLRMAFSFSNAVSGGGGFGGPASSGAPTVRDGAELQEIQTDKLGFTAINGTAQLRLTPTPWPADALPPPSASLLAVASRKGLLAGAGPDGIYLTSTEAMRAAFREKPEDGSDKIRSFTPQMHIPYPRPGHVIFSSDENVLVASQQAQGGLDAFQLSKLAEGQSSPAVSISTNGQGLRALIPNPSLDNPHVFALITNDGDLLMADFETGGLRQGKDGNILKSGVTCCSWSNKGKQLVAGGADGTVTQIRPDGTIVAVIPKSTSIPDGSHVSGVSWLENDSFFIIYTPSNTGSGSIDPSEYYIVTREPKTTNFTFQKLPEVVGPFGLERIPPFHFIIRLRNFPPLIQDMLILTASCSTDIGIVTRADRGFSPDQAAAAQYALTTIGDDSRRGQMPTGQDMSDTSPIGMALDLSSNEKVPNPIPSDVSVLETPGPVPAVLALNNEGILLSWWLIYSDSVKQNTRFSGFEGVTSSSPDTGLSPPATTSEPETQPTSAPTSTFGQSSFASTFSKPSLSAFGSANSQSTFGGSSESAFGKPSSIGKSSWTSTGFGSNTASQPGGSGFGQPGFGQPSFGSAVPMGGNSAPTFGSASSQGGQSSGFGQPATGPSSAFGKPSAFGSNSGFGGSSAASPFASAASKPAGSSGFASFSQGGGFGGFGGPKKDEVTASPFAKASGDDAFAKPSQESLFSAGPPSGFGFGNADAGSSKSPFGASNFNIGSTFKGDGTAKNDLPKPKEISGFGMGSLEDTLGEADAPLSPIHDKEEEMGDEREGDSSEEDKQKQSPFPAFARENQKQPPQTLVTPPSTLSQSKATPAQPVSNLFGTSNQESTTPFAPSTNTGWSFGQLPSTTPKDTPAPVPSTTPQETPAPTQKKLFGSNLQSGKEAQEGPKIKEEPPSDDESGDLSQIPEPPLPPDPVSKPGFGNGNTSVSSRSSNATASPRDDAPLPPDFVPANKSAAKQAEEEAPPSDKEEGEVDEDEFSSDFEGSEEDAEEDVSPIDEPTEENVDELHTSPESSSKSGEKSEEVSPTGGLFTNVSKAASQKPVRQLFGEVGQTGPIFPPPKPQESPRSPSPVRNLPPTNALRAERPDSSRSVSAPAHPRSVIDKRKAEHAQSPMAVQAAKAREEEIAKQRALKATEAKAKEQAEADQLQSLEDNEDDRLREELQAPVQPSSDLDDFVTYQPKASDEGLKSGIPAQIERLYQDINSMVYTFGINSRSLSAFMKYQQEQQPNASWPSVLASETPMDALNDEQVLDDVGRLHEGNATLEQMLKDLQIKDVATKLQECHRMLSQDLLEFRTQLAAIRKSLTLKSTMDGTLSAPLSADQASVQQDLRKSSALAQSKLVQMEDSLSVLRSRLSEITPSEQGSRKQTMFGATESRKKPTVEAVSNTIAKMTAMAEKKSADIDVLEAQLRRLDVKEPQVRGNGATPNGTPKKSQAAGTPTSGKSSVYHTPDSKFGGSTRSTPRRRTTAAGAAAMISAEDREKWQMKAQRKKEIGSLLVDVLAERRKAGSTEA